MKIDWKKLIALVMAAVLMLSLTGLGEVVIEDGASVDGIIPEDNPYPEDLEVDGQLDALEAQILDFGLQTPEKAEEAVTEEITEDRTSINALVRKVSIGVKEKYTIDTSSLSGKLTFATADKKIATVSKKGVVVGKKVGSTKITVTDGQGKKYKITFTVAKAPNKVTLNANEATLKIGDTLKLRAKLPNKTASNKLTWKSSNKRVATVSDKGEVEAIAAGTATITVRTFNGKTATCKVTVKGDEPEPTPVPPLITVDKSDVVINVGETVTVKLTYNGSGNDRIYLSTNVAGIVRCEWSRQWVGRTTDLYLTGVNNGSTIVTIHVDAAGISVPINVTVVGSAPTPIPTPTPTPIPTSVPTRKPGYTGDIISGIGTDVDAFSNSLDDPLQYFGHDTSYGYYYYYNNYIMVFASDVTRTIYLIDLRDNTSGKYTLCGIHPGMSFYMAQDKAISEGWKYMDISGNDYTYYATYKGQFVCLNITKSGNYVSKVMMALLPN